MNLPISRSFSNDILSVQYSDITSSNFALIQNIVTKYDDSNVDDIIDRNFTEIISEDITNKILVDSDAYDKLLSDMLNYSSSLAYYSAAFSAELYFKELERTNFYNIVTSSFNASLTAVNELVNVKYFNPNNNPDATVPIEVIKSDLNTIKDLISIPVIAPFDLYSGSTAFENEPIQLYKYDVDKGLISGSLYKELVYRKIDEYEYTQETIKNIYEDYNTQILNLNSLITQSINLQDENNSLKLRIYQLENVIGPPIKTVEDLIDKIYELNNITGSLNSEISASKKYQDELFNYLKGYIEENQNLKNELVFYKNEYVDIWGLNNTGYGGFMYSYYVNTKPINYYYKLYKMGQSGSNVNPPNSVINNFLASQNNAQI